MIGHVIMFYKHRDMFVQCLKPIDSEALKFSQKVLQYYVLSIIGFLLNTYVY